MFRAPLTDDADVRLLLPHHAEQVYAATERNVEHLARWLPWVHAGRSVENKRAFIRASLERLARDGSFDAGIFLDGSLVGVIGLHYVDQANRKTSIGYWMGEEATGRGLVTRACKVLLAYAFGELGLNRVEIRCATGNAKSRAIPERLGFREEGVTREVEWLHDRFVDHVVYAMLREEWPDSPAARD